MWLRREVYPGVEEESGVYPGVEEESGVYPGVYQVRYTQVCTRWGIPRVVPWAAWWVYPRWYRGQDGGYP